MNNDFDNDPRGFLKTKWEGLPGSLRALIILVLLCVPPPGWLVLFGFKIWFYHWGE
jgi:hypothetical protein